MRANDPSFRTMKNLTIRAKITIWFIIILSVILALSYAALLFSSQQATRSILKGELKDTVDNDLAEIEFHQKAVPESARGFYYMPYADGYLEIDDDFLKLVGGIGIGLYTDRGVLLYGEDLIPFETSSTPFIDGKMRTIRSGPDMFFVYDRMLKVEGAEKLWVRGSVDREQLEEDVSEQLSVGLLLLPLWILFAAAGAYLITRWSLRPIRRLTDSAKSISSGSDLKRRIDIGEGENEVQQLTRSYNEMMQRLDESFEAEKQFTSDVSHELRTPMAAILAQCELALEEGELSPEEARDALLLIQRQGNRMNEMINDMLMYTRIDRHHERYPFEEVDLSTLVEEVCEEFDLVHGNEIALEREVEGEISMKGSVQLLERMLSNLLENALRYGQDGGIIKVCLRQENSGDPAGKARRVILEVTDRGIGIAKEDLPRIFDRFYQADPSRSGGGIGLGLSMVQEIAQIHGGSVSVLSTPGEGSTFIVVLDP